MNALNAGTSLSIGLALSGLGFHVFWSRYAALGGGYDPDQMLAYLRDEIPWPAIEHDVAARALNECCATLGLGVPVAYADEL
jgi:hypothetical protein